MSSTSCCLSDVWPTIVFAEPVEKYLHDVWRRTLHVHSRRPPAFLLVSVYKLSVVCDKGPRSPVEVESCDVTCSSINSETRLSHFTPASPSDEIDEEANQVQVHDSHRPLLPRSSKGLWCCESVSARVGLRTSESFLKRPSFLKRQGARISFGKHKNSLMKAYSCLSAKHHAVVMSCASSFGSCIHPVTTYICTIRYINHFVFY